MGCTHGDSEEPPIVKNGSTKNSRDTTLPQIHTCPHHHMDSFTHTDPAQSSFFKRICWINIEKNGSFSSKTSLFLCGMVELDLLKCKNRQNEDITDTFRCMVTTRWSAGVVMTASHTPEWTREDRGQRPDPGCTNPVAKVAKRENVCLLYTLRLYLEKKNLYYGATLPWKRNVQCVWVWENLSQLLPLNTPWGCI